MRNTNDINDNEIRVIGDTGKPRKKMPWWLWAAVAVIVVATGLLTWKPTHSKPSTIAEADIWLENTDTTLAPFVMVSDTTVDSIHLHIYTPYNTIPELHVGPLSNNETCILLAAMAADIRRDNEGHIVPMQPSQARKSENVNHIVFRKP